MEVPQDPWVIVACGIRRQFSMSQAMPEAIFADTCKLTVNGGGVLTSMTGKGQALDDVRHSDRSAQSSPAAFASQGCWHGPGKVLRG